MTLIKSTIHLAAAILFALCYCQGLKAYNKKDMGEFAFYAWATLQLQIWIVKYGS